MTNVGRATKTEEAQVQMVIITCTKFEFNSFTPWGNYGQHRHHLLNGAQSTTGGHKAMA